MFQINDTVSYSTQGVCVIKEIKQMNLSGKTENYYVLKPIYSSNSTIYVPIANENLTAKMRRILSRDEIKELIKAMPDEETVWIENDAERKEKYQQIISSSDHKKLVGLIKTLYLEQSRRSKEGKRLRQSDEQLFKRAEAMLYGEFALVLDISPDQVIPFLHNEIGIESLQSKKAE